LGFVAAAFVVAMLGMTSSASAELVAHWQLDGNGLDSTSNGLDGTVHGDVLPAEDRLGNPSGAMSFNGGGGDYIDVGNDPLVQINGAMTIAAWVYLDSTHQVHGFRNARVLSKLSIANDGVNWSYSLNIEKNAGGVDFPSTFMVGKPANAGLYSLNDDVALPTDQWVHMTGVYTPSDSLKIYLDGNLAATRTDDVPASQYSSGNGLLYIGNFQGAGDVGWYGSLDDIRLYNQALTQEEIRGLIPEPSTALLLALGFVGLLASRRRSC
jgi:hypothetical protein